MSMVERSAEEFAQRAFDLSLLDQRDLEAAWDELGTRSVPASELQRVLLRRGVLTNYQVERLTRGERTGFFYGDYKVLYLVGAGSFARVFRAVHKDTRKVVALKVLRRRYSDDPMMTDQFLREGRMGAQLRHPNIVPIYEVRSEKRNHFMVMNFVEGRNLRDLIKARKKLSLEESLRFATHIAAGLTYAAGLGITHRDLKLSNVLISTTGRRAELVDFGLAAVLDTATEEEIVKHPNPRTIDYAGLERATGVRKDDPRSDIYFAGCMLYHMLTGKPPLQETRDRVLRLSKARFDEVAPVTRWDPRLPHRVVMVVNKAMELNVNRRYQTPAEMLEDLKLTRKRLESGDENVSDSILLAAEGKSVMVVDANTQAHDVFRRAIRPIGYRVLVMTDALRAVDFFGHDDHRAHCVLFNCQSLGRSGLEAFNRMAQSSHTKDIPSVLLLDKRQMGYRQEAQLTAHRVAATLPLSAKQLQELLRQLLGLSR